MMPSLTLAARIERWPIAGGFTISRGAKTEAVVIVAEVSRQNRDGKAIVGRGECVPYARYGETPEGTLEAILAMQDALRGGLDRQALQAQMRAGAARNALDCALWDLEARVACAAAGVTMIEQPLPAGHDQALSRIRRPVAVCADESVHDRASLEGLRERYDAINIKLDKTGGLTEALAMAEAAKALGFDLMVGCMVATSLAMAPALMIAQGARVVDLDGPLLLAKDRDNGLRYDGSTVYPPGIELWG